MQAKCTEQVKDHRKANLKKLVKQTKKPPYPLARWPGPEAIDGTPHGQKRGTEEDKEEHGAKKQKTGPGPQASSGRGSSSSAPVFKPLIALEAIRARIQAKELAALGAGQSI